MLSPSNCHWGDYPLLRNAAEDLKSIGVCSFPSWAKDRREPYAFGPENLPGYFCTHIVWLYVTFTDDHMPREPSLQEKGGLRLVAEVGQAETID